jgi:hypothetical protein
VSPSDSHHSHHRLHLQYAACILQMEALSASVASLGRNLPGVALGPLVEKEPMLLRVDAAKLVAEIRRLMPVSQLG